MDGSGHAGDDARDAVNFVLVEDDVLDDCGLARLRRSVHEDGLGPTGGGTRRHEARQGGRGCRGGQRWRRGAHCGTDTDNVNKVFLSFSTFAPVPFNNGPPMSFPLFVDFESSGRTFLQ